MNKSIHQLRAIAQGYDVADIFSKTEQQLTQAIEQKQIAMVPKMKIEVPASYYGDMNADTYASTKDELLKLLKPYLDLGLKVSFPEPDQFHMSFDKKEDAGTIKQPLRVIVNCAAEVMR